MNVFYISRLFSNVGCNTLLRLLHLPYDIEVIWKKMINHIFFTVMIGSCLVCICRIINACCRLPSTEEA